MECIEENQVTQIVEKKEDLNPQQRVAVETIDRNVAVSAGAGSGKTNVLVKRFQYILQQSKERKIPNLEASEILAITFTRKAAGEMKSRIRQLLYGETNDIFWREQLRSLEQRAHILTIHSLCSQILRENPVETQLDPGFAVQEDFEEEEFLSKCLKDFINHELKENNVALEKLIENYGLNSFVRQINSLIPKISEIVAAGDLQQPYVKNIVTAEQLLDLLCCKVNDVISCREELTKEGSAGRKSLEQAADKLDDIITELKSEKPVFISFDKYIAVIKGQRGALKESLAYLKSLRQQLEFIEIDKIALPLVKYWQQVLVTFNDFVQTEKQKQDVLGFDDLELLVLKLLKENEQIRHKYQKRFRYIMVDEFQDTNDRQRQLIYLLCGDNADKLQGNKLFIVGDPKQSIYRFRGAQVSVFNKVKAEIAAKGGLCIELDINYRSHDTVLDTCNKVFEKLLGVNEADDVFFKKLIASKTSGKMKPLIMEVLYNEFTKEQKRYHEAVAIAEKIHQLHDAGKPYGKITILLRAMTHCETLAKGLQRQGVPYVIVDGRGFYEQQEVMDILHLLAALHNRYRSLELAGILRSPYFGLNDETLTSLFLSKACSLWDAVQQANPENYEKSQADLLKRAAEKLTVLRNYAALSALPELWEKIWQELSVDVVLTQQEHGINKLANVKKLRQLACTYSQNYQATLADWLEYVERLCSTKAKETAANVVTDDAVQIMTIHKSKGLEFDTVFLPMLDTGNDGSLDEIKYSSDIGLGIRLQLESGKTIASSVFAAVNKLNKIQEQEERKRQLYVAMTRAEEYLFMSGVINSEKKADGNKKELAEMYWLHQLKQILSDDSSVEWEQVDFRLELPPERQLIDKQFTVTSEMEKLIAPLPEFTVGGRTFFTASALQTYLHCQRRYYYQQLMELPEYEINADNEAEQEQDYLKLPAYLTGLVVHRALEVYRNDAEEAFAYALQEEAPGCRDAYSARQLFMKYINSDLYKQLPDKQERELKFLLPINEEIPENQNSKPLLIEGIIDCLAYADDGTLILIDYKTGKPPVAGDVNLGYAYQLALYKYAAEKMFYPLKVSKALLHFLQDLSVWELPLNQNYLHEACRFCFEIGAKSKESEFLCRCDGSCQYCTYKYICTQNNDLIEVR